MRTELSSRVDAQRELLAVINARPWQGEKLFALSAAAIQRWAISNAVGSESSILKLLNSASQEIFVMANHSDDPVAGTYAITKRRVMLLKAQIEEDLRN